jgi:hypothetical protein
LLDCYRGDTEATLIVHQDGERDDVRVAAQAGWTCQLIQQIGGHYLARVCPAETRAVP